MDIDRIIELVEEWIDDKDLDACGCENTTDEEKEEVIEYAKDIAKMHINRGAIEDLVDLYDDEEDVAIDYIERIWNDAYTEALMACM